MSLSGSANSTELEQRSTCRCGNTYNHGGRVMNESVCGVQGSDCPGREAGKCQEAHAVYRVPRERTFAPSGGRIIAETTSANNKTTITISTLTEGNWDNAQHSRVTLSDPLCLLPGSREVDIFGQAKQYGRITCGLMVLMMNMN